MSATRRAREPGSLEGRLRSRIAATGPITFAEFMDAALYDPDEGFYSRHAVGERGEFVTSPHVSALFGVLVARQVEEFWRLLGEPARFTLVEAGAGDGTLASQVVEALTPDVRDAVRYVAVERSPAGRDAVGRLGVPVAESLGDLGPVGTGCVVANELLDNLPFHLVRGSADGPRELYVSVDHGRFVLVEGDPSHHDVARMAGPLEPGAEMAVGLQAYRFLEEAAGVIERGYLWLVDYGYAEGEAPTPVHGYRGHRVMEDVLADPGSRDITAGVDFGRLVRRARRLGLRVWGPERQRTVLLRLGFRELEERARRRQGEAISERRGIEALRIHSNRTRANLLVREGLGDFLVLCLGKGVDAAPPSFR